MKKATLAIGLFWGTLAPATSMAAWQNNPPGQTEYIQCGTDASGALFQPVHFFSNWNEPTPRTFRTTQNWPTPSWWTYANKNKTGFCDNWFRGRVAGGAIMTVSGNSVPFGRNTAVKSLWLEPLPTTKAACGHRHLLNYVWGWRLKNYFTWTVEFVSSTVQSTYWDTASQSCKLKGTGNPDINVTGFTYGDGTVRIPNSPYIYLWVALQGQSHAAVGCGQFQCFHNVGAELTY